MSRNRSCESRPRAVIRGSRTSASAIDSPCSGPSATRYGGYVGGGMPFRRNEQGYVARVFLGFEGCYES